MANHPNIVSGGHIYYNQKPAVKQDIYDYHDDTKQPLTNIENGEGNYSLQQKIDAEGGQPLALGKWSFAEGRGDNFEVRIVSKDLENNKISVAKYNEQGEQINGARNIRANAILWIPDEDDLGAYYYVTEVTKTNPVNTLTLDAIERVIYDGEGTSASHIIRTHYMSNVLDGTTIRAYMGVAAASDSHIEGNFNNTVWLHSDTELNEVNVSRQHAEGSRTLAAGYCTHTEGENTRATGDISHAEGKDTIAEGATTHAEGDGTRAIGPNSHAEGEDTIALGVNSHAEGGACTASGGGSHAGGYGSVADGDKAFAHGFYVNASTNVETPGKAAFGQYNENDPNDIFEVGNGNSSIRKNAISVDYHGNTSTGSQPIKKAAYRAIKTFTPSQTLFGGQMLIRIGQYADGGIMSTIYNPRLRNLTTGEEINIAITDDNIVVNSTSTANLKWDLRGGGNNHNGINILSTTIDNYKVFEINAGNPNPGWRYLQYCINNMTFNANNTYELSVLSPYSVISEMATLNIYYEGTLQTTDSIVVEGGSLNKFTVGNSTNSNNTNAFEIRSDGSGKIQTQGTDPDSIAQKGYVDSAVGSIDLTNYVTNTDYATSVAPGVIILGAGLQAASGGRAVISAATEDMINAKTDSYRPIVSSNLDYAVASIVGHHVTLTQAQYDDLTTKDPNTYYYIIEE